jgi:predicted DNA binding CopG/RHH family protein
MKQKKSLLESLSSKEIEAITKASEKKKNVPLVKSQQVNMRMDSEHLEKAQVLAKLQGIPFTTFLTQLLREDLDRLWSVYNKAKKGKASA